MSAHGVMFHHFYDHEHPRGQGAISADELGRMIEFLGLDNILSAEEFLERAVGGTLLENHCCLTFDDALKCQYDIAVPVLESFGLTAFWFIYSSVLQGNIETLEIYRYFRTSMYQNIEGFYQDFFRLLENRHQQEYEAALASFRPDEYLAEWSFYSHNDRLFRYFRDDILGPDVYTQAMNALMGLRDFDVSQAANALWMTDENIKLLHERGHTIGLHSYTHPTRLAELPMEGQRKEYLHNLKHLEGTLGESPRTMAHPCNSYNQTTLSILEELGVLIGFRSNMKEVPNRSRFEIMREDHINVLKAMRE